jgi:hypothetical protein
VCYTHQCKEVGLCNSHILFFYVTCYDVNLHVQIIVMYLNYFAVPSGDLFVIFWT